MMTYTLRSLLILVLSVPMSVSGQETAPTAVPDRIPGQSEIIALAKAGKHEEVESRLFAVINGEATPDEKVVAFGVLCSTRRSNPAFDVSVLDEAFSAIEQLYSDVSPDLQYAIDHYHVERESILCNWDKAAEAARLMREEWEKRTDGVLMVYADEPVLLCRAGKREQAMDVVEQTWLDSPNNYRRNEAVRLNLAVHLSDTHDYDMAFKLLSELKESFPDEFESNPYGVQNWINYSVRAKLADNENDARRRMLEIAGYAQSLVGASKYERVRGEMLYGIACLLEKANDISAAKEAYEVAIGNPGDGPMGENIHKWSVHALARLNRPPAVPETQDIVAESHSSRWWIIVLNAAGVCVFATIILALRRIRPRSNAG